MVFNWFRRQYSDSKEQPQDKAASSAQPEPQPESDTSDRPEEQSQQPVAEDYLAWAKAAYKNIQAKQQTQTATTATESQLPTEEIEGQRGRGAEGQRSEPLSESQIIPTEKETSEAEISATVALEAVTEELELLETAAAAEVATPETGTPEVEKVATVTENAQAIAPESTLESPEIPEPSEEEVVAQALPALEEQVNLPDSSPQEADVAAISAPVPFWARDDRQARLERLKATAIEESEPEVQPVVAVTESATAAEIPEVAFDDGFLWSAEILASQGRRPEDVSVEEITWLKKLRQGLDKTRRNLINQLKAIVGQGPLNQDAVMEIESLLLQADVGVEATDYIIKSLQNKLREQALPPDAALAYLKQILRDMLNAPLDKSYQATFAPEEDTFNIWLITGVNGAGKTTTIGKIAHIAQKSGYKCLIGAADTFRAAAVQQVKVWGQRSGVEVVANPGQNTDPAAVVFDAIAAAKARGTELLLVDTAGRLQNKKNLMEELSKIRRIIDKKAPEAHGESLLVLDATLGQNGLRQAQVFSEAAKLSGVVLTKLDGTAKGGVALAVVQELGLPIRVIGAGEGIEDLRPFSSYEFIEALLSG